MWLLQWDTKHPIALNNTFNAFIVYTGIGGVGKSTIFKQIKLLHAKGFTDDDRGGARVVIVKQMVKTLLGAVTYSLGNKTLVTGASF